MKIDYLYPEGTISVQYVNTTDARQVLAEIFEADTYGLEALKKTGYEVKTCIDVGAFQGFFAKAVRRFWPNAKVVAIEPNSDFIETIQLNGSNVVINAAVRYDGKSDFYVSPWPCGSVMYDPAVNFCEDIPKEYTHRTVKTLRLDDPSILKPLGDSPIDLLKLDCEGSEFDILCSMPADLRNRIRHIAGEYHHLAGYHYVEQIIKLRYPHLQCRFTGHDPLDTISRFEASEVAK